MQSSASRSRSGEGKTHHLSPHNIPRSKTFIYLDAVLLGSPNILNPNDTLPLALEHGIADDQNSDGRLAGADARHAAEDDITDLG